MYVPVCVWQVADHSEEQSQVREGTGHNSQQGALLVLRVLQEGKFSHCSYKNCCMSTNLVASNNTNLAVLEVRSQTLG